MAKEGTPSSLRLTGAFKKMIELLMRERVFNDRTAYIEQMVRDDWDKRATPQMQAELTAFLAQEEKALNTSENARASKRTLNSIAHDPVKKVVKKTRRISERVQAGEHSGGKV